MDVNYNFNDARKHKTTSQFIQIYFLVLPVKANTDQINIINPKRQITSTTDNVRIIKLNTYPFYIKGFVNFTLRIPQTGNTGEK